MYYRINVKEKYCRFQRIVCRLTEEDSVSVFNLNTVTYDATSLAYQALIFLRQLTQIETENYQLVIQFSSKKINIDFSGGDTLEKVIFIAKQFHLECLMQIFASQVCCTRLSSVLILSKM